MQSQHASVDSIRRHLFQIIGRTADPALIPYHLFALIYIMAYSPFHPHPPETPIAALLKIVPICYLIIYTYIRRERRLHALPALRASQDVSNQHPAQILEQETGGSLGYFIPSLIVSGIGDICLVYKFLFLPGIFFFCIAHVFNVLALRKIYVSSSKAWLSVPLCFLLYAALFSAICDPVFRIIVFLYAVLIHSMLFFAIAGYESYPCSSTLSSMLGASLFVLSDFMIAYNKWLMEMPLSEVSILLTYYLAQLLLAVSNC